MRLRSGKWYERAVPAPTDGSAYDRAHAERVCAEWVRQYADGTWDPERADPATPRVPGNINVCRRKPEPGYVYFVRAGRSGRIKIGKSRDPHARLEVMSCGSPERLTLVAMYLADDMHAEELAVHARFSAERLHGEWFMSTPRLRAYVESVRGSAKVGDRSATKREAQ